MNIKNSGKAQTIVQDGVERQETTSITFAILEFDGPWDDAKGEAAVNAMVVAGNAITGGAVTVSQAAAALGSVAPHLSSPVITAAAQAADEVMAAQQVGGLSLANVMPIVTHFAENDNLLTGTSAQVADVVTGMLSVLLKRK